MPAIRIDRTRICPVFTSLNFSQAGAVQNTWYNACNLQNVRIGTVSFGCTVANETLDVNFTIEGVLYARTGQACTAATNYYPFLNSTLAAGTAISIDTNQQTFAFRGDPEFRTFKVDIRKTTNAGGSALRYVMGYWKWR